MTTQKESKHLDPPRYPRLIHPLEQGMKDSFEAVNKKILIDITKQLTTAVKTK